MKLQAKAGKLIRSGHGKCNKCLYIGTAVILSVAAAAAVTYFFLVNGNRGKDVHDRHPHHNTTTEGVAIDVKSCSDESTTILSNLRLHPYPLIMPGNVSASFDFLVNRTIQRPTVMKYNLMKKVLFWWVTVSEPAAGDLCDVWPLPGPSCPPVYVEEGIPCSCPIHAGSYKIASLSPIGFLYDLGYPKLVERGRFWAQIDVKDKEGNKIVCHEVEIDIN